MSNRKTLTFKISIPLWLYRLRWGNIKNYASWLLKPNRCSICGTKMNFGYPELDWREGHIRKMMMHYNVEGHYTECVCPSCVAKSISDKNAVPKNEYDEFSDTDVRQMCDCCKQPKRSYKWVAFKLPNGKKVGLITGREWWNGFYFCADCLRSAAENGTEGSGIHGGYRGKDGKYRSVPLNNFGLPVIDGKVRFPL